MTRLQEAAFLLHIPLLSQVAAPQRRGKFNASSSHALPPPAPPSRRVSYLLYNPSRRIYAQRAQRTSMAPGTTEHHGLVRHLICFALLITRTQTDISLPPVPLSCNCITTARLQRQIGSVNRCSAAVGAASATRARASFERVFAEIDAKQDRILECVCSFPLADAWMSKVIHKCSKRLTFVIADSILLPSQAAFQDERLICRNGGCIHENG